MHRKKNEKKTCESSKKGEKNYTGGKIKKMN